VVNKTDGMDVDSALSEFYQLGLGEPFALSAAHNRGVKGLLEEKLLPVIDKLPKEETVDSAEQGIKIALIGRPNVGKSTLTNRMLGEERVVVFDMPGTTRDSIYVPMERHGQRYTLIDTAGVRRKGRVEEGLEKFSVIKTLKAIEDAHVAVLVYDAQEGITEQDLHILGFALDAGRGLVIAVNKWDGLDVDTRESVKTGLDRRLRFVEDFVDVHFISALHGTGVGNLFDSVHKAYASATKELSTPELTRVLEQAVLEHNPPVVRGRRVKMRYAHSGGHLPPVIVIHGNQVERLPEAYKRYLMNYYRQYFKLYGTPIRMEFKSSENPYAGKKNELTPRQVSKKRRMLRHIKKSKR
jgi:GTP-binding protein